MATETIEFDELAPAAERLVSDLFNEFMAEFCDRAETYPEGLAAMAFLEVAERIADEYTETEH